MRAAPRSLRSRLFSWFVGAILVAMMTASLVVFTARPEPVTGAEFMARNVADRLAALWEDPAATDAFVGQLRDVTGFDAHLLRGPHHLAGRIRRAAQRGSIFAPDGPEQVFIPVLRNGSLVGALEIDRFGVRAGPGAWWRFALALLLVLTVLSAMAGGVADQVAKPLERLAHAADRFGAGDLATRADVGAGQRRWVAREVRGVAVSFNRMAERLEAMVRGQRELLGAISHEIRSPLGRARVALEIARDRLRPEDGRSAAASALDDVETQLGAMDGLLGDLLDVTRVGLADLRLETRPIIPWLAQCLAEEPAPPPIDFQPAPESAEWTLRFDPTLLGRVVHNLVRNARTHGHPPSLPIEVAVTRENVERLGPCLRIRVRDRGPGFPAGFAPKAFDPFVRGDPARGRPNEGAGSGLGLTIVRRIAEAHRGRAFANNRSGEPGGAEVGVDLPIAPGPR